MVSTVAVVVVAAAALVFSCGALLARSRSIDSPLKSVEISSTCASTINVRHEYLARPPARPRPSPAPSQTPQGAARRLVCCCSASRDQLVGLSRWSRCTSELEPLGMETERFGHANGNTSAPAKCGASVSRSGPNEAIWAAARVSDAGRSWRARSTR